MNALPDPELRHVYRLDAELDAPVDLGDTPQGTLEYRTIFAVGMLLFVGTFGLNLVSAWLRERFREEYA